MQNSVPGSGPGDQSRRVLVVQDDADIADLLHRILDGEGLCCALVASPQDAFRYLDSNQPALILFDYEMGGVSGRSFYEGLRQRGVEAPAILLSAWSDGEALAEQIGVPFVAMPFDVDDLVGSVQRALAPDG